MDWSVDVLLVEDTDVAARLVEGALEEGGNAVERLDHVETLDDAEDLLGDHDYDVVLLDLLLPDSGGLDTLDAVHEAAPETAVVVLTGTGDREMGLEAIQRGAQDYMFKEEVSGEALTHAIRYAVQRQDLVQNLEDRMEDLETFARHIGHDLKSPLQYLESLGRSLEEELGEDLPDQVSDLLDDLHEQVSTMNDTVEGMLTYARASRRDEFAPETVQLDAMVSDMVRMLDPPDGVSINVEAPEEVRTLRMPLRQVLQNLLANAIQHGVDDEGHVEIDARDTGGHLEVSVVDDGPGIPSEDRERIFEPLVSLSEGDTSGIGLATVRRIVEREGGSINLEEAQAGGACFTFTWPLLNGDAAEAKASRTHA